MCAKSAARSGDGKTECIWIVAGPYRHPVKFLFVTVYQLVLLRSQKNRLCSASHMPVFRSFGSPQPENSFHSGFEYSRRPPVLFFGVGRGALCTRQARLASINADYLRSTSSCAPLDSVL